MKKPYICIKGGSVLKGTVQASGAKNAALPLLFSTILADGEYKLRNVPFLKDVATALKILQSIGFSFQRDRDVLTIQSSYLKGSCLSPEMVQEMRASFLCLGPLLARYREVKIPLPGGCKIGKRPVDLHLKGLETLGATVSCQEGWVHAKAPQGLKGNTIVLDFPTVGGTENLIMASVLAKGKTVIQNGACEPEILDLIHGLKKMGAQIEKTGEREWTIKGVKELKPFSDYQIIPDRIEVGTLILAGAITGGEVKVEKCNPEHLTAVIEKLQACGYILEIQPESITLKSTNTKKSISIETEVYPGFPTDLQSPFIALMTQLEGESSVTENIFENRFRYLEELKKFKVSIRMKKERTVFVNGLVSLKGALVQSTDLRASSGLILAALVAEGETHITGIDHLDRGYENLHIKLKSLGASIERCD